MCTYPLKINSETNKEVELYLKGMLMPMFPYGEEKIMKEKDEICLGF